MKLYLRNAWDAGVASSFYQLRMHFAAGHCLRIAIEGADTKHFSLDLSCPREMCLLAGEPTAMSNVESFAAWYVLHIVSKRVAIHYRLLSVVYNSRKGCGRVVRHSSFATQVETCRHQSLSLWQPEACHMTSAETP